MSHAESAQLPASPAAIAPIAPPGNQVVVTQRGVGTTIMTQRDISMLRARGEELSNQLTSAAGRRSGLQQSLRRATGADKAGLEQRLGVLDARIARLEMDIDENGKQLASLPAALVTTTREPFGFNSSNANRLMDNITPIAITFTIFVLAPIAVSVSRMFWKRGSLPKQVPASPENAQRLERMEQAIDSIAIEIERVSEGQRFVTRLLAEQRPGVALGTGQPAAEGIALPVGERVGAPR